MARKTSKGEAVLILIVIVIIGIKKLLELLSNGINSFKNKLNDEIFKHNVFIFIFTILFILIVTSIIICIIKIKKSKAEKKRIELENIKLSELKKEQEKKLREIQEKISILKISDNREDYIIRNDDYNRGNPIDNRYRKNYSLTLLKIYDNSCAKCGNRKNGFDLDHFIFPKNSGGNFMLRNKDGYWVNNAIPLCKTCNRSKGDRSYKKFFTDEELLMIYEKNVEMTKILNKDNPYNL